MHIDTNSKPGAPLTEKELFAHFLRMQVKHSHSFGGTFQQYQPEESLRDCGGYGDLEDFTNRFADKLEHDDGPEEALDCMISDIQCYLENLQLVRSDFQSFKAVHLIMPEEPDWDDTAAYLAWERAADEAEKDPHYRPVDPSNEAGAA